MSIVKQKFGVTKEGKEVNSYTLSNKNGMEAVFLDYGAILKNLYVPDAKGEREDVVLGYDNMEAYENNGNYFGSFIGRNGNRIGGAVVTIDGKEYTLAKNDGSNNLHSGPKGFEQQLYEVETGEEEGEYSISFSRLSPDGEMGFPGNMDVTVTYTLTDENELAIEYFAVSDQDTIANMTNHSYFNLSGHSSGSIENHKLWMNSGHFAVTSSDLIPTGELRSVEGTPMDFRVERRIGDRIDEDYEPLAFGQGYDHHFEFDRENDEIELMVIAVDEASGRKMKVFTDRPGVQFYAGNCINGTQRGKNGAVYEKRSGFCLETQVIPDSIRLMKEKNALLKAEEEYSAHTVYKFSWQ